MGLLSKTIEGNGWSFDKKTGRLTINGTLDNRHGIFESIAKKVISIEARPGAKAKYGYGLFSDMENLREANLAYLDVSDCKDMTFMFKDCSFLSRIDLKTWKISKVESIAWLFSGCSSLKEVDLSSWDVSSVKDFGWMFSDCYSLESIDLTGWVISENAKTDYLFGSVPHTAHIFSDDVSVVRLLPEGVKPEPHGSIVTRFNTALAVDLAGDHAEAIRQYRLAAEQGSSAAAYNLALKYLKGTDVPKDEKESNRWLMRAAELGDTDSMYFIAKFFYFGNASCEKDYKQALYWAKKAKEKGDLSKDLTEKQSIDDFIRKIENNIAFDAAFAAYHAEDYVEAAKQYRIAIEKGSSAAAWNLGLMYGKGQGVPKSFSESFQWRLRAAKMGNAPAMCYLAERYHDGKRGVEQDDEQALAWAKKAKATGKLPPEKPVDELIQKIEKSLQEDPFNEGKHWLLNSDPAAAVHYFKIAAEQDNVFAIWTLGSIYTEGRYRKKNDEEAFRWFLRGAELGHAKSMYTIAERYYTGTGGAEKDYKQALVWATKAKESCELPADMSAERLILKIETSIAIQNAAEAAGGKDALQPLVALAERGSGAAASHLAKLYLNGEGVEKDRYLALNYYAMASEKGDPDATSFLLGQDLDDLYQNGIDAHDRGDRNEALYSLHAAYRAYKLRAYRNFSTASKNYNMSFFLKQIAAASDLFSEEAKKGTPWANYYLGEIYWQYSSYHDKVNIPEDRSSAIPFMEKAMDAGFDHALIFMAQRYYLGDCPAVALERGWSMDLLARAARSEDPDVRYIAAYWYMNGFGEKHGDKTVYTSLDPEKALELMTALAENGHAGAMYCLARMYAPEKTQFPNDLDKWLKYAKSAAELGNANAIKALDSIEENVAKEKQKAFVNYCIRKGDNYYWGTEEIKQDIYSAIYYYEQAAEFDAKAAMKVGNIYHKGIGLPQDEQEALKWFMRASEFGSAEAQFTIGEMYYFGEGVPVDYAEAAKWFTKSATQGHVRAQYSIGVLYNNGKGVPKSTYKAKSWFEKAAEQNHSGALLELGRMHYNYLDEVSNYKDSFESHFASAKEYLSRAAELGEADAKKLLRRLERH